MDILTFCPARLRRENVRMSGWEGENGLENARGLFGGMSVPFYTELIKYLFDGV